MIWDIHQRQAYEERAGIMQFDGGLDRAEAERRARRIIDGVDHPPAPSLTTGGGAQPEQPALVDDAGQQFFTEMQRMLR